MIHKFRNHIEQSAFGVCSELARYIGIAPSRVRMYFIYLSCATLGSPILMYLFMAFWLNIRQYIRDAEKNYEL
jgi:phage shock protein PspC (stress-responsive transcriptional regulator)